VVDRWWTMPTNLTQWWKLGGQMVDRWWTVKGGSKTGLFTQAGGQMLDYGNFTFSLLKLTKTSQDCGKA